MSEHRKTAILNLFVIWLVAVAGLSIIVWGGYSQNVNQVRVLSAQTQSTAASPTPTTSPPQGIFPDPSLTPGDTFSGITAEVICVPGYSSGVRNVTVSTKKKVYEEYGLSYPQPTGMYETDHFIPLELGGSNDIKNLWPEAAEPEPGYHQKDKVENYLHKQVCSGNITLQEAWMEIRNNWFEVYKDAGL